jgi:hypothetical protein
MEIPSKLTLILSFLIVACHSKTESQQQKKDVSFAELGIKLSPSCSYSLSKAIVEKTRKEIALKYTQKEVSFDSLSNTFTNLLVNEIIPHWYYTKWSFDGHTEVPRKGNIACSYFTSTTLSHLGVKLNRYKLAQKNPFDEAKFLAINNEVKEINGEYENLKKYLITQADGIYFVGLSETHVGFLLNRKGYIIFIDSDYVVPKEVTIEFADKSRVLTSFQKFFITPLSNNKEFILKWINSQEI